MPLQKEENFDEAVIVAKIGEIKKKIQLSEGQRKAHFEECDTEKKRNIEKIRQLKKEVKEIYKKLAKPPHCEESVLKAHNGYPKDVGSLRNKNKDSAVHIMDYKCIDLRKKLDLLAHENRVRQAKLKKLADEHQELMTKNKTKKGRKVIVRCKPVSTLENQIHRVELNMMEAEHVNKKYKTIRTHLLGDSVVFESSLRKLENDIQTQENEIRKLESINSEAVGLRDVTKGTLLRQEITALNAGKGRDNQLQDFKRRVEERKLELERLERRIFPSGRMVHQDSSTSDGTHSPGDTVSRVLVQLEANFSKLKQCTGETDTEEVLHRFLSQKETRKRLTYLKTITEKEKKELEVQKECNLAELEAFKFAEVKDKEQSQEEVEKMNNAIEAQKNLKESHDNEVKRITEQLYVVREHLYSYIQKLEDLNSQPAPEPSEDIQTYTDVLDCLVGKIIDGLELVGLGDNFEETLRHVEEEEFQRLLDPILRAQREESVLFPRLSPAEETKQQKQPHSSLFLPENDDEEDVPTRTYLKRQAQLIVDAKSRRKFNRVINFPRPRK